MNTARPRPPTYTTCTRIPAGLLVVGAWAGVVLAAISVLSLVLSLRADAAWCWKPLHAIGLTGGCLFIVVPGPNPRLPNEDDGFWESFAGVYFDWASHPMWVQWNETSMWLPRVHRTWNITWFSMPLWIPFVVAIVPAILLRFRRRAVAVGCCRGCGYDLRGSPSGICPECGVRREDRQGGVDERAIR
jgi:hypothetical protein